MALTITFVPENHICIDPISGMNFTIYFISLDPILYSSFAPHFAHASWFFSTIVIDHCSTLSIQIENLILFLFTEQFRCGVDGQWSDTRLPMRSLLHKRGQLPDNPISFTKLVPWITATIVKYMPHRQELFNCNRPKIKHTKSSCCC